MGEHECEESKILFACMSAAVSDGDSARIKNFGMANPGRGYLGLAQVRGEENNTSITHSRTREEK